MNTRALFILALPLLVTACDPGRFAPDGKAADTIVYGNIYSAEDSAPEAEAFAVKDGKFIYVGTVSGADEYLGRNTEVIDHRGKGMVTPGFYECHAHYLMAEGMNAIDAVTFDELETTPEVLLTKIKEAYEKAKAEGKKGVFAFGWNFQLFDTLGFPTLEEIDKACPDLPLYAGDEEVHKAIVNSMCMHNAGIIDESGNLAIKQIKGGEIVVDANGKPTGLLKEQAGTYCRVNGMDFNAMLDAEKSRTTVLESQKKLLKNGFVSYMDGWTNFFGTNSFYEAAESLDNDGELKICLGLAYEIESSVKDLDAEVQEAFKTAQYETAHVNPHYVKLFMDGTVESGTGYVRTPYLDGHIEPPIWPEETVAAITSKANANGYTMHIHTMGEEAVHEVVNAFVSAGSKPARNTLVHVRNIPQEDFTRCAANDIVCVSGILWHNMSEFIKTFFRLTMPEKYVVESYPIKSYFDNGAIMTSHSDYPALSGSKEDPFFIMEISVTGINPQDDGDSTPYWPKELITREQMLKALTINGAFQMHCEDERGSIKVGKWADFVLSDQDAFKCSDKDIHNTKVVSTWFEGHKVYPES